jgi:LmbE family N-acetylglucosaminyl deacetylase
VTDLSFNLGAGRQTTILFIGAHSDDIEIGCGGTILSLVRSLPGVRVHWVVLSAADATRASEARDSAAAFLGESIETKIEIEVFRESYFPYCGSDVKDFFESLKTRVEPDLIFTHYRGDLHQDHRITSELTWNTFRGHSILEYEIPKYDGDLGQPNIFVPLTAEIHKEKVALIHRHFVTQRNRQWFDRDVFAGLARLRGMESNAATSFAEAFYGRKLTVASIVS